MNVIKTSYLCLFSPQVTVAASIVERGTVMTCDIMTIFNNLDRSGEILPDLGRTSILQLNNLTLLTFGIDDIANIWH